MESATTTTTTTTTTTGTEPEANEPYSHDAANVYWDQLGELEEKLADADCLAATQSLMHLMRACVDGLIDLGVFSSADEAHHIFSSYDAEGAVAAYAAEAYELRLCHQTMTTYLRGGADRLVVLTERTGVVTAQAIAAPSAARTATVVVGTGINVVTAWRAVMPGLVRS